MGMGTDIAVKGVLQAAARAAAEGRPVLVYRQNISAWKTGWSGEIGGMGEVIAAAESRGWWLDKWVFDGMQSSHGGCILLFRRAQQPPPPPQPQQQPGLGELTQQQYPQQPWR